MPTLALNKFWTEYLERVVPQDAHPSQVIETRRAFYGGMASMFELMRQIGDIPDDPEGDKGLKILAGIDRELKEFAAQVGKKY